MIYFKQYGEMRTGTNYLKRLIELNFKNVSVLGSILGWKHGMYDLTNNRDETTSHLEWLDKKTKGNIVYSVDNLPLIKHNYDDLKHACSNLKYLISIKKPIPFILSYKKFRLPNKPLPVNVIVNLCKRYNSKYRDWLTLYERTDAMFVAHESVLLDYKHVLFNIETRHNLKRINAKLVDENRPVKASTDIGLIIDKSSKFDKDYYLHEKYLKDISNEHINVINDNIDHDLVDLIYKLSV